MLIEKTLKINKSSFFKKHLEIVNTMLPVSLTTKEIELIAYFLSKDIIIISSKDRKEVMQDLKLSPGGLSNYITSLKEKKVLFTSNNKIKINNILLPKGNMAYNFKLILNES